MTVEELIDELKKFDPLLDVLVFDSEGNMDEPEAVYVLESKRKRVDYVLIKGKKDD